MSINTVVAGTVSGGGTNQYDVKFSTALEFSVLFQVSSGSATLDLESAGGTHLATVGPGTPDLLLGQNFSPTFTSTSNSEYHILVHGDGQYRLEVYSTSIAPEHTSAAIAIGDIVSESLEAGTDVDNFHFTGAAGDELIVYLQAMGIPGAGTVRLRLTGPGTNASIAVSLDSPAGQSAFELDATPRFTLLAGGEYTVTVTAKEGAAGTGFNSFAGPYQFQVKRIDHNPEHADATVAPGATVTGEAIDYVGDMDRFAISGTPGQEMNVFFQTVNHDTSSLVLEVSGLQVNNEQGDPLVLTVKSRGTDRLLTDNSSARFKLPVSGHATIEVSAPTPFAGTPLAKGAYIFKVSPIDRAPEVAAPVLAIGDFLTTERIDVPGDVDEFSLSVPTADTLNLVMELDPASLPEPVDSTTGPDVQVFTLTGQPAGAIVGRPGPLLTSSSGTYAIAPGQYVLRVWDASLGMPGYHSYSGPYHLHLYRIRSAPETAPGTIAIGDTIPEALSPSGDVDVYSFAGHKGDYIDIQLQGLGEPGGELAYELDSPSDIVPLLFGRAPTASPNLGAARSGRITLPVTGTYRLTIRSNAGGTNPVEAAPYRLALVRVPATPEVHSVTLALGELMTNEALDTPEDVDEFTVHAVPGTEVVMFITAPALTVALAEALDPTTKDTIRTTEGSGARGSTGRFLIPASGTLLIRVSGPAHEIGLYELQLVPINRAPELTPAAYVVGDTVNTETIDLQGADIDEYRFNGTVGQKVVAYFQTPNGVSNFPGFILEVLTPDGQQVLGSVTTLNPTAHLNDQSTGTITLPVAGQYMVRIRGISDISSTGMYRFSVQAVP